MLEVNDFNAVRISLASPEQIRSWSYGEVTKPETINYRTLKPEKDGLFCEKIFGPTKDFECYCGKYKRVRYKGIICDKCGVEVARSKVRRERMGHIELASPVSHIWFVKGTPSRLGLLLDISPRQLERVLYFAQNIITFVDEGARKRTLEQIRTEMEAEVGRRSKELRAQLDEIEQRRRDEVRGVEDRRTEQYLEIDEEETRRVSEIAGSGVSPEEGQGQIEALQAEYRARRAQVAADSDLLISGFDQASRAESEPIRERQREINEKVAEEHREKIEELERDIKQLALIPEAKVRDWQERYPGVYRFGMGAEAMLDILGTLDIDALRESLQNEINSTSGQRRKKATKRLRVVEALRKSGNRADWMVFTVLPVLPPDLRPMVQLDGGRFATSDLNDLYRRVINRNNRLKRLLELGAPEIIIRNEKRMLQEAVDSLIDNGRRGRAVSGSGNHKLKSLSDMLKGKQGRFRQNLLGKRVDYSGRSVIVVGPELKLHQCGLPKRMALELFKPFVMHALVSKGMAHNIKSAKRIVERARPEVWDVLDEVIKDRPVLLNRAPTLHRLGIQAFEPVLIDGSAIQIHPLVCSAFNADFDGDQMAVHVPLSREAVAEARQVMLSTRNLLSPSSGEPTVAPTLDMVLGCYYMTDFKAHGKGAFRPNGEPGATGVNGTPATGSRIGTSTQGVYSSFEDAKYAYNLGMVELRAPIRVRDRKTNGELIETCVGRIIFNDILPAEIFDGWTGQEMPFRNKLMDKKELKTVVARCYQVLGNEQTAEIVDQIKRLGFQFATRSGITIAVNDIKVPAKKGELLAAAQGRVDDIEQQYLFGEITDDEKYQKTVAIWNDATDKVTKEIQDNLRNYGSVYMMANSGAKGSIAQIRQMAGMRGLMTDPSGRIIDLPIKASFREGLSVLEYFISTHGARKGLADTALRTADSGYLTRRLIDVAQDVIILEEDCGTENGIWLAPFSVDVLESMRERILGRFTAAEVVTDDGEIVAEAGTEITEALAEAIEAAGVEKVYVRSPLSCESPRGVCKMCYGRNLATGELVRFNEAVGIVAAQSIGEPGTQLTMRTFHTGGVAGGLDITSGLPRVEEVFEARDPKGRAVISEIDGVVEELTAGEARKIRVLSTEVYRDDYELPAGAELIITPGQMVEQGTLLAQPPLPADGETAVAALPSLTARISGRIEREGNGLAIFYEEREQRDYTIPAAAQLLVRGGDTVRAGDKLTEGSKNPQDVLLIQGREAVQLYLVEEVQKVYRSQGVNINDKHIEVIVRQMLRRVRIDTPGDTALLPGELVDRFEYEDLNRKVLAEGGEPATAQPVLLGVTKASLSTDSFLAAASFQETTRVLTDAAINGKVDHLLGLKENVIIGKLIPARAEVELPPLPPRPQRDTFFLGEGGLREITRPEFDEDGEVLAEVEVDEEELDEEIVAEERILRLVQSEPSGVDLAEPAGETLGTMPPIEATAEPLGADGDPYTDDVPEIDTFGDGGEDE